MSAAGSEADFAIVGGRLLLMTQNGPVVGFTEIERLPQAALGILHRGIDRAAGHRR